MLIGVVVSLLLLLCFVSDLFPVGFVMQQNVGVTFRNVLILE